jgi:hypothetical protein
MKENEKTFKEYTINVFTYTPKDTSSNWCHNYMSEFFYYTYLELIQVFCKCHHKIQNDDDALLTTRRTQM